MLTYDEMQHRMTGRWPDLLQRVGMDEAALTKRQKPCPMCGGTDRFMFDDLQGRGTYLCRRCSPKGGNGFQLLVSYSNISWREAFSIVGDYLGDQNIPAPKAPSRTIVEGKRVDPTRARQVWAISEPITVNDQVDMYLRHRGLNLTAFPSALRYARMSPYFDTDGKHVDDYSAMLGMVTGADDTFRTVHRTYLRAGRKAEVPSPKKLASPMGAGSSIKLFPPNEELAIAEGIETALSVHVMTKLPVWSVISAANMLQFRPPPCVKRLRIYGDNDRFAAGQAAAWGLMARVASKELAVEVLIPTQPGSDWNDVLTEGKNEKQADR
jgi:putative DNA primase/helicase